MRQAPLAKPGGGGVNKLEHIIFSSSLRNRSSAIRQTKLGSGDAAAKMNFLGNIIMISSVGFHFPAFSERPAPINPY